MATVKINFYNIILWVCGEGRKVRGEGRERGGEGKREGIRVKNMSEWSERERIASV